MFILKTKKLLILFYIALILITIFGCKSSTPVDAQKPETTVTVEKGHEVNWEIGEITDPFELQKLWEEYFYDSIATVCNTREFNKASEIDPNNVAIFCWFKFINEYGKESLEMLSPDSTLRLFPLKEVLEYSERYFGLTSLDMSEVLDGYYSNEKEAFTFNIGDGQRASHYNDKSAWGHLLKSVRRNNDGTITAELLQYNNSRPEVTKTLNLKQRDDGSLYFISGRWDYIDNNLVSLTGTYERFDKIAGFDGNMEELVMIGETDGKIIIAYAPYYEEKKASLMLVSPQTFTVEKKLVLSDSFKEYGAKLAGDKILIRLKNSIILIDTKLEKTDEIILPKTIAEKINRIPKYNKNGIPDSYFGGYDVSRDLTKIVYTDEIGLKLMNLADNSETLLAETVKIMGSKLINKSYHCIPRFIANDKKVITTMTGYDYSTGYTIYDLEKGSSIVLGNEWGESSSDNIYYDTGLLNVNSYSYDSNNNSECIKTLFFEFETGEVHEINLEDTGDTGYIRDSDYGYIGQNYGAIITTKRDVNDNANNMFYINRLNIEKQAVEAHIISVKAAGTHILGVLADGRIVFWYNFNPSENGVCITR